MSTCLLACKQQQARQPRWPGSSGRCVPPTASNDAATAGSRERTASPTPPLRRSGRPRRPGPCARRRRRPLPGWRDAAAARAAAKGQRVAQLPPGTSIRSASATNSPASSRAGRPRRSLSGTPRRAASAPAQLRRPDMGGAEVAGELRQPRAELDRALDAVDDHPHYRLEAEPVLWPVAGRGSSRIWALSPRDVASRGTIRSRTSL